MQVKKARWQIDLVAVYRLSKNATKLKAFKGAWGAECENVFFPAYRIEFRLKVDINT